MNFEQEHFFRDIYSASLDMSIRQVIELIDTGALDLNPAFQRGNVWSKSQQSHFIESLLTGLPVPAVFLAEEPHGRSSVIDGRQRLIAINKFVKNEFRLTGLEYAYEFDDFTFDGLPHSTRMRFLTRSYIRFITIDERSDSMAKNILFVRLNTGGERLTQQEIRNAKFPGILNESLKELAEDSFFRTQIGRNIRGSRSRTGMADVEYVLRFFALLKSEEWHEKSLLLAMDRFMAENRHASPSEAGALSRRYLRALRACEALWGEHAFQLYRPSLGWRFIGTPWVYDAQMHACDSLPDSILEQAVQHRDLAINGMARVGEEHRFPGTARTNSTYAIEHFSKSIRQMLEGIAPR
ncbi:DUF262 domain-containing protein [Micromonospora chalcea]|uniref:DUF262 domain-containing protein n=1 Tax=Micromonospora TaxID=1873 RepID=UPI000DE8F9D1|nr:DUF262 domain-containing protein [Micromonospora sp. LHW51205]RBQ10971.1 hypothetical protein DQE82_10945 [Micromonospora sp. LHW51205]